MIGTTVMQYLRAALFVAMAMIWAAPGSAQDCVATVKYPPPPGQYTTQTGVCTNNLGNTTVQSVAISMTELNELREQNKQLRAVVSALQELLKVNKDFRDAFNSEVAEKQQRMRDEVVGQLSAIPGRVAADPAVVSTIAVAVKEQLAKDEGFKEELRREP